MRIQQSSPVLLALLAAYFCWNVEAFNPTQIQRAAVLLADIGSKLPKQTSTTSGSGSGSSNNNDFVVMKRRRLSPITLEASVAEEGTETKTEDDDNNDNNNNKFNATITAKVESLKGSSSSSTDVTVKTSTMKTKIQNGKVIAVQKSNDDMTTTLDNSMTSTIVEPQSPIPEEDLELVLKQVELEAEKAVDEMLEEECEFDPLTGGPKDELCVDEEARRGFRKTLKGYINKSLQIVRGKDEDTVVTPEEVAADDDGTKPSKTGDELEEGWESRAASSALKRNAEVWKFALKCVFRVLKPRKMKKTGTATEEEIRAAQIDAAEFIRDGLLELGPSFVKLGQVASTRTDVLPTTYTDVLKTLTDEVPGFNGERAKEIVSQELGRPCDEVFQNFSAEPLKAASLGQVHTATYKGTKVAIKVQRAGLKELFDTDLKNLKKLAVLLEKFDPKSDGADRDWVKIYEESERLLYLEIDYLNEVRNLERFDKDFKDIEWVRVPKVYKEVTTPRVLTMEFVESFKLTDVKRVKKEGLDPKVLAKRVADSFLRQIVETSYFHADPHSGNLCVNKEGQLVFYDFGQMDELKPKVREGLRTFCTALFKGGPTIDDTELAINAKELVRGVEQAGVLSKGADRLAVEKLARFFMRSFKDSQLGKKSGNIKETIGPDLQTLTDNNSFRFPATFTFVFRAFVSVEGIGKELDSEFDLGKLAQPFIQKFIDDQKGYNTEAEKKIDIFSKATGLNLPDINKAVSQPKKVAYIEETIRAMESGNLKIRVRSLENEKALERLNLRQNVIENMMMATMLFSAANLVKNTVFRTAGAGAAFFFLFQSFMANTKIKKFDKTQLKYVNSEFEEEANENTNGKK